MVQSILTEDLSIKRITLKSMDMIDHQKKGQHVKVFKFSLQINSNFLQNAKVISSDEHYNCFNISFKKEFTPAHCSLEAAVTKNNQIQYLYKTLYLFQTKPYSATMPRTLHL